MVSPCRARTCSCRIRTTPSWPGSRKPSISAVASSTAGECEHLAFRNFDTDWQLWVEVGERPIPRKMVITSKTLNNAPQYTLRVKGWKTGVEPAAEAFTFVPPAGAKKLDPEALIDLDELPQGAPEGGNQ